MSRKNIGVFVSGDDEQLHCTILQGIKEKAFSYDYNVVSFHSLLNKTIYGSKNTMSRTVIDGEYSIFWGHDISVLDGIIILGDTYLSSDTKDKLISRAKEHNIPVVNIDNIDERCCSICFDDSRSMEMVVSHIVEVHNCQKIYFVSGFKGNLQSEERVSAYRKILRENNIEINEQYICYGEFNTDIAADQIEKLVNSYGIPDAIVCANDSMALGCIAKLSKLGYSVPEDCIVTGFDGIKEGQNYVPALTSVKRAIKQIGVTAVEALNGIFQGESLPDCIKEPAELILNQSCGCVGKNDKSINAFYNLMNSQVNDIRMFEANLINMTRLFTRCNSIEEIINIAMDYAQYFNLPKLSFYLNESIMQAGEELHVDKPPEYKQIYSPMLTRYTRDYKSSETSVDRIYTASVLSDILGTSAEPIYLGLTPLYYRETIIGFIALDHLYCNAYLPMLYTWLISTCSTIGSYCLQVEMKMLIDTLDNMYINDSLTGLYNRFGLHRYAEKIIKQAKAEGRCMFGVEIDLDRLKYINDTYGYMDGDNAIIQVANAMRYATDGRLILSRTGGDEYFSLGLCDDDGAARCFIDKVNSFLDSYNQDSSNPYNIECSCGYYVSDTATHNLEEIMKYSDIEMYKVKNEKKRRMLGDASFVTTSIPLSRI